MNKVNWISVDKVLPGVYRDVLISGIWEDLNGEPDLATTVGYITEENKWGQWNFQKDEDIDLSKKFKVKFWSPLPDYPKDLINNRSRLLEDWKIKIRKNNCGD